MADFDEGRLPDEDESLGEPIPEIVRLREEPSVGFFGRVFRTIERRRLGSEMTRMSLGGLVMVFFEFVSTIFGLVEEAGDRKKENSNG